MSDKTEITEDEAFKEAVVKEKVAEEISPQESVEDILARVEGKVDSLNELFIQKIRHTVHEEQIVDQMHTELQRYKEDMYSQLVRPILLDMIEIRDSIRRMAKSFAARPEKEQFVPLKTFSDYEYDIQEIMEKNNVSIYEGQEGDLFNPLRQRAVKKIKTPVKELHGRLAESLSSGYDYTGKTISPEKVAVYVYEKPECGKGDNQ